jgi:hypothetical protein
LGSKVVAFADHPLDSPDRVFTTKGPLDREKLSYRLARSADPSGISITHAREWTIGDEIVRRDVWIEVLVPLTAIAQTGG